VYTREQFEDWLAPLGEADVAGRTVLELGCGNGSLLVHMSGWGPSYLVGVDLGSSVQAATATMRSQSFRHWEVRQADLTTYQSAGFDIVYCIGVLHHLQNPRAGFDAVVSNVKPAGCFHCWVYAREGNAIVRWTVEPLRRVACRLPWWLTKYGIATPLAVPFYLYAKTLRRFRWLPGVDRLPLFQYSLWISGREFHFFRHVAFDQLVTPQTTFLDRATLAHWLKSHPHIDPESSYIVMRNGNSWKFGGRRRTVAA
jgi:SAM-dependent methyltransferase